jgi:hypothetical protein
MEMLATLLHKARHPLEATLSNDAASQNRTVAESTTHSRNKPKRLERAVSPSQSDSAVAMAVGGVDDSSASDRLASVSVTELSSTTPIPENEKIRVTEETPSTFPAQTHRSHVSLPVAPPTCDSSSAPIQIKEIRAVSGAPPKNEEDKAVTGVAKQNSMEETDVKIIKTTTKDAHPSTSNNEFKMVIIVSCILVTVIAVAYSQLLTPSS